MSTGSLLSRREKRTIRGHWGKPGSLPPPQRGGRLFLRRSTYRERVPAAAGVGFLCLGSREAHLSGSAHSLSRAGTYSGPMLSSRTALGTQGGQPVSSPWLTFVSHYLEKHHPALGGQLTTQPGGGTVSCRCGPEQKHRALEPHSPTSPWRLLECPLAWPPCPHRGSGAWVDGRGAKETGPYNTSNVSAAQVLGNWSGYFA